MIIAGNICTGLATLVYLLFLGALSMRMGGAPGDMGDFVAFGILSLFFFLLISCAFCAVVGKGQLDWLGWPRGAQYTSALIACLTLTIAVGFSAVLRASPTSDVPWAIRGFIPWAPMVLPAVLIAVAVVSLNGFGVPVALLRGAFATLGAIGLLTGLGLLAQWMVSSQQHAAQEIRSIEDRQGNRDRQILDQVKAADPEKDFGTLLAQSSKFEQPPIRELAMKKLFSNSNFTASLSAQLRHYYYYSDALTFLRDNDPPDRPALAEPIRDAFLLVAQNVRDEIHTESNPSLFRFVADASDVLLIADKYANYGVDYVPAIRAYRAALDEHREEKLDLDSRRTLDRWLAKKAK